MKTIFPPPLRTTMGVALLVLPPLLFTTLVFASPGAHGPNGEHLDGPASATGTRDAAPRLEAKSETFELVGRLQTDEFSMFINRFETSEPVLGAKVEVDTGNLKAAAKFHADLGDYAVDDKAFLAALDTPGRKAVVVTIIAGDESDLLEGTLASANKAGTDDQAAGGAHGHGHGISTTAWLAAALAVLLLAAMLIGRRYGGSKSRAVGEAS